MNFVPMKEADVIELSEGCKDAEHLLRRITSGEDMDATEFGVKLVLPEMMKKKAFGRTVGHVYKMTGRDLSMTGFLLKKIPMEMFMIMTIMFKIKGEIPNELNTKIAEAIDELKQIRDE